MRIGILSDTHLTKVDEVFKEFIKQHFTGVDAIIHAGDMVDASVAKFLSTWEFIAVSGNMDGTAVRDEFPTKRIEEISGKRIGIIHGWGHPGGITERIIDEFRNDEVDCIVFGHTHAPYNEIVNGILMFNPGAPLDKRFSKNNTIGYLNITAQGCMGEIKEI
jgi:uncharacterized protein